MPTYSISRIGTFHDCPLKYNYRYIERRKTDITQSVEAFLGSMVHEALEKLYRDKQVEKLLTLEQVLEYFNRRWREEWNESILIVKKDYTAENYRKTGERHISDYYDRHKPFDEGRVLGLETTYMLPLDDKGEYKFHIRIDRLMSLGDGMYEVHDYKTGGSLDSQEKLDGDRQLAMYSLWVRKRFKDCRDVRLVWHFTAFDQEMESWRTEEQLEMLRGEIMEDIRGIEAAEEYPAKVSNLCGWCEYKPECPEWRHGEELEAKEENEYLGDPGLRLVDEYVKTKAGLTAFTKEAEGKIAKLEEALAEFAAREDVSVVFGSEKKVKVSEYESFRLPGKNSPERAELIEALVKMKRLEDVSTLDTFALSKILRAGTWENKKDLDAEDLEKLRSFERREVKHKFSISKKS
jgi:putative RecB family exonuclease